MVGHLMTSPSEKRGYGHPPKNSQFKKGQSGNPNGRPRGSKNSRTLLIAKLDDKVRATIDGDTVWITKREAGITQQANNFAKGDLKVFRMVTEMEALSERLLGDTPASQSGTLAPSEIPASAYDEIVANFMADMRAQGGEA